MSYIKKYGLHLIYNILEIILFLFIATILFYNNIINENTYKVIKLLILLISIFINSFLISKNTKNKKIWEGLKYGTLILILLIIPTILFSKFQWKIILYYLLIYATSTLGSTFTILKKEAN